MGSIPALDDTERQALEDALDDEYKAHTTYDQVIHDLGPVRPFVNIVDAEARRSTATGSAGRSRPSCSRSMSDSIFSSLRSSMRLVLSY